MPRSPSPSPATAPATATSRSRSPTTSTSRSSSGSSGPPHRRSLTRAARHAAETIRGRRRRAARAPSRCAARSSSRRSPSPRTQAGLIAAVALTAALAGFGSALFGQNVDPIAKSFDVSELDARRLPRGHPLRRPVRAARHRPRRPPRPPDRAALVRRGAVRRRTSCRRSSPNIEVFTAAQLVVRAAVNAVLVVGGIAVVEEAPEGARAFAVAMLGLAGGAGFALSVVLLPAADLGTEAWRIAFGVSALSILLLPCSRAQLQRDPPLRAGRGPVERARPGPRGRRQQLPTPVLAPRRGRLPHQRLQRAVGAVHQPLPVRRPRLLVVGDRRRSAPSPRDSRACSGSCSPDASPRPAAAARSRSPACSSAPSAPSSSSSARVRCSGSS